MRGAHPERALERRVAQRLDLRARETVLVALSGGPDSVALAALTVKAAQAKDASVIFGHVNHGTRKSAWQDEGVALALGTSLGARTLCAHLVANGDDENRLRDARYVALAELAMKCGAARILTAHHAEDQTESVLLALFRGAGPDGLLGIAPRREISEGIALERPLLDTPKSALIDYVTSRGLATALDPTNAALGYRRNALRATLADLRAQFGHLDEAIARTATILREEREGTSRARVRRALRAAVAQSAGDARDVTFERLDAAARAIEAQRAGRTFLRPGVEVVIATSRSADSESERKQPKIEKHRTA